MGRPRKASIKLPPHVHAVQGARQRTITISSVSWHRREEERIKLPGAPFDRDGTPNAEWWRAYRELSGEVEQGPKRGTFSALIVAYKASPEWNDLSPKSQSERVRN